MQIDLDLLRENYAVTEWNQPLTNVVSLTRAIADCDLVFGWFASKHTLLPTLLAQWMRRPSVLVVGGYDTANLPSIGYGHQRGGPRRWVSQWIMHHTDRLLPYSLFARDETIQNARANAEQTELVYLGLPTPPCPTLPKERLVITVGDVTNGTLQRKGLVAFVRAATLLPDVPFVLIGEWRDRSIDYLRGLAPANVAFTGRLTDGELYSYMTRASVYVQASQHEAFALAVAESMLHLCIPVVARAGALPELVGDTGFYAASTEPEPLAAAIRNALDSSPDLGRRARERIVRNFSLGQRRHGLKRVIDSALNDIQKTGSQRHV